MEKTTSVLDVHKEFIESSGPYKYFVTYTCRLNISADGLLSCIHESIRRVNRKLFGKNYNKCKGNYIEGFAFVEVHPLAQSKCKHHVHLIVKSKEILNRLDTDYVINTFKDSVRTIKHKRFLAFHNQCVDVQECYSDGVCEYCFKGINLSNTDNYKLVSNMGIY